MTFEYDEYNDIVKAHPGNSDSIVIPSNVPSIANGEKNDYAFIEFKNKKFSLSFEPNSQITRIGSYSFYYCRKLASVDFSNANSLKSIGSYAFYYCDSIPSLTFGASLETIEFYGAFAWCYKVTNITFPDDSKIKSIAAGAFAGSSISTFRVPSSCTSIYGETFAESSVQTFTVQERNSKYIEYDGSIFTSDYKELIIHKKASNKLSLPPQTTVLKDLSLNYIKFDIKLEKNISVLGSAFQSYRGKRITIFGNIETLSAGMFANCINLVEIKFYNEVNNINENSFKNSNKLRRIVLIYPVKSMVKTAFPDISRICFYGDVASIKAQINDVRINECKIFFNTCLNYNRRNCVNGALPIIILLIYS